MLRSSLLLVLGMFLMGCGGGGGAVGVIEGTVQDSTNQAVIENAAVSVVGTALQAVTDALGHYAIGNVPAGAATVRAEATGYFPVTRAVQVTADSTATADFLLSPQATGTIEVRPGESIQAAVDVALPGQTVLIHPGTYTPSSLGESLVVFRATKNGVTMRGAGASPDEVVLDGNNQVLHVIFCDEGIDRNTVIENLTVTGGNAFPDTVLPQGYTPVLRPEITDFGNDFYNDGGA